MEPPPAHVTVRTERTSDVPFVRFVEERAFGRGVEADIVDAIRGTADWYDHGSLVALDPSGKIVGHVLLSRGRLVADDAGSTEIGMIGPVAVMPDVQRRGVGSTLMRAEIATATARGLPMLCLVGHPNYYPRFGFEPARALGIRPSDEGWPDDAWMVLRLPAWTAELRGVAHFAPAFGAD
jgi:putative acetyltransferase